MRFNNFNNKSLHHLHLLLFTTINRLTEGFNYFTKICTTNIILALAKRLQLSTNNYMHDVYHRNWGWNCDFGFLLLFISIKYVVCIRHKFSFLCLFIDMMLSSTFSLERRHVFQVTQISRGFFLCFNCRPTTNLNAFYRHLPDRNMNVAR